MHYLVSLSGGAGSTVAAHHTIEKFGSVNVTLCFADTNTEHPSLYASLTHTQQLFPDVEFIWLNDGRNIWDVFDQFGYLKFGGTGCKASLELKKIPLAKIRDSRWKPGEVTSVTGLDFMEADRVTRFDRVFHGVGHLTYHPLATEIRMTACQQVEQVIKWGYPAQVMYENGYPHNNCGGGCILAGISQWVGLYHDFPETFRYHRDREAVFFARTGYCILRDRRGGPVRPLLLSELEKRIISNDLMGLQEFRSTCGCMTPPDESETTESPESVPAELSDRAPQQMSFDFQQ